MEYSNETLIYSDEKTHINFEYLYSYNNEYLRFVLNLKTEKFIGNQEFYLYVDDVSDLIDCLGKYSKTLVGEIIFNDSESESYMKFSLNGYNNITLSGEIGDVFDDVHMKFNFKVDQTSIMLMKDLLASAMCSLQLHT